MEDLENDPLTKMFAPFCTYRSPAEQWKLYNSPAIQAGPWRSPHQYGMAVDFAAWINDKWTWKIDQKHTTRFHQIVQSHPLQCPIPWDPWHVEWNGWPEFKKVLS